MHQTINGAAEDSCYIPLTIKILSVKVYIIGGCTKVKLLVSLSCLLIKNSSTHLQKPKNH
jgi:hypothetical protein